MSAVPRVSIGIPVFNGENYLDEAIASVRAQTFDDLEVIVSDNASTDRTGQIALDHAASDERVRYVRNERNLGAAPNYNRAWSEARAPYFKWLAHDDRIAPDYLSATPDVLDREPDVVLCNTVVDYIDCRGDSIGTYRSVLHEAGVDDPARRFAVMVLRSHSCVDFFGLVRRSAMQDSLLHGPFHGADRAFLAQMTLRGRLVQVDRPLVEMREHEQRYTRVQQKARDRQSWHDSRRNGAIELPTWRLYREYLSMLRNEDLPVGARARAYGVLARWWLVNYNALRVGVDVAATIAPGLPAMAETVRERLFGAPPGHLKN